MEFTQHQIVKIKKELELSALNHFFKQLKQIIVIPTGEPSDQLYDEYFKFVKKVDQSINRRTK